MREIFSIDQYDEVLPRGAPFPKWTNYPRIGPEEWATLPPGPRDPGFSTLSGEGSGFPSDMPKPILIFNRPLGRVPPLDISLKTRGLFGVSDRAKVLFERLDPDAFEFVEADTVQPDGSPGPRYWIMDVVRTLDAVDPNRPDARLYPDGTAALNRGTDNVFRFDVLGNARVFRLPGGVIVFCDTVFKDAFEEAGLTSLAFSLRGRVE